MSGLQRAVRSGAPLVWLLGSLAGCLNEDVHLYEVTLSGEIRVADDGDPEGTVYVTAYHAWAGEGELAHPLEPIESVTFPSVGELEWTLLYPLDDGEGLKVYAWLDRDGDGVLCAPGQESEASGMVEVTPFPVHEAVIDLRIAQPCGAPDVFLDGD